MNHILACRYAGLELTHENQMALDCCCYPLPEPTERCARVTGSTRAPMDWKARRGKQLDNGRYEVLCGYPARYYVLGPHKYDGTQRITCCSRDLEFVVREFGGEAVMVLPIPKEAPSAT